MVSQDEPESAETSYLDAIANSVNKKETKSWNIQDGKDVYFKIDTGAEVLENSYCVDQTKLF